MPQLGNATAKSNGTLHSAEHFQQLLKEHPPQTSSRASLSNWACAAHNIVNERLGKPEFDCGTLADVYKCGCADEPKDDEDIIKG
ncbi:hypothetical protein BGX21_009984 [Mortierella sp. AD011]|nr:hypothetical protein BGX21_009984 [Mortierella sp. AD011]